MLTTTQKLIIGLCLILPLLVVINLALVGAYRQRHQPRRSQGMPHQENPFSNPWRREDSQLDELSQRVAGLRPPGPEDNPPGDHPDPGSDRPDSST